MSVALILSIVLVFGGILLYSSTAFARPQAQLVTIGALAVLILTLSFLSYYLQPVAGFYSDLQRITNEVRMIQQGQYAVIAHRYVLNPLSAPYIAIGALLNNINALKFTSALIMFWSLLYIPYDEWKNKQISRQSFIFTVLLTITISNFANYVFGVRQGPACALAIVGAYLFIARDKRNISIIILTIAILLHFSAIVIVFTIIVSKVRSSKLYIAICSISLLYTIISYVVIKALAATGNSFGSSLLGKMNGYYVFGTHFALYASTLSQTISYLRFLVCVMILALYLYLYRGAPKFHFAYIRFFIIMLAILVGSIPTGTPFRRFSMFALYASIPLIGYILTPLLGQRNTYANITPAVTSRQFTRVKAQTASTFAHYFILLLLIVCIGTFVFYDWHSYSYFYVSTHQIYQA